MIAVMPITCMCCCAVYHLSSAAAYETQTPIHLLDTFTHVCDSLKNTGASHRAELWKHHSASICPVLPACLFGVPPALSTVLTVGHDSLLALVTASPAPAQTSEWLYLLTAVPLAITSQNLMCSKEVAPIRTACINIIVEAGRL